jgi:hemerythrin-like domain-containing protein
MQEKDQVAQGLESQNVSLERKCERLRDYIRKLTAKCDEWKEYADKQSKQIQKVKCRQQEHVASSNSGVENTARSLASNDEVDEKSSSAERRMLDRVATLAGEEELDALALELQHFGLT